MRLRHKLAIGSVLAQFFLAATPSFAHQPGCYIVWADAPVMSGHSPRIHRRSLFDYSAASILDINFYVLMPSSAERDLDLQIYTPKGHPYQTLTLAAPDLPDVVSKKHHGRHEHQRSRFVWVTAKLPVAGTTIVNNSLYGKWRVVPVIQGESTPCAKPLGFSLRR